MVAGAARKRSGEGGLAAAPELREGKLIADGLGHASDKAERRALGKSASRPPALSTTDFILGP